MNFAIKQSFLALMLCPFVINAQIKLPTYWPSKTVCTSFYKDIPDVTYTASSENKKDVAKAINSNKASFKKLLKELRKDNPSLKAFNVNNMISFCNDLYPTSSKEFVGGCQEKVDVTWEKVSSKCSEKSKMGKALKSCAIKKSIDKCNEACKTTKKCNCQQFGPVSFSLLLQMSQKPDTCQAVATTINQADFNEKEYDKKGNALLMLDQEHLKERNEHLKKPYTLTTKESKKGYVPDEYFKDRLVVTKNSKYTPLLEYQRKSELELNQCLLKYAGKKYFPMPAYPNAVEYCFCNDKKLRRSQAEGKKFIEKNNIADKTFVYVYSVGKDNHEYRMAINTKNDFDAVAAIDCKRVQ